MVRMADDWITVPAAAQRLGLQVHTVYALIDKGELAGEVTMPSGPKRPGGQSASDARRSRTTSIGPAFGPANSATACHGGAVATAISCG